MPLPSLLVRNTPLPSDFEYWPTGKPLQVLGKSVGGKDAKVLSHGLKWGEKDTMYISRHHRSLNNAKDSEKNVSGKDIV